MTQWNTLSAEQQALAAQTFVALSTRSTLRSEAQTAAPTGIDFGSLYRYATDPEATLPEGGEAALRHDGRLREALHRLLAKTAVCHLPRAAAASSGTLLVRELEQFRIRLRESRADAHQVYVLIELPDGLPTAPQALFIYGDDGSSRKFPLPPPQAGVIQLLTSSDSPLINGLQDHRTEIFLR
jgi:hypothetical protein